MKLLLIILVALASPALADSKDDAKKHMEAAATAYKEGRFDDTLAELNKAYALDPRPELHYSIGQVYVKLDRCEDAILSYESFLASKPSKDRADIANQAIDKCKTQIASRPAPTPTPPPEPTTSVVDTEPPPGMPETQPVAPVKQQDDPAKPVWWKDKLGLALTGGGAVVTIVGLVLVSNARGKIDSAESADNYGESQGLYDDAQSGQTTGLVVTAIGLAATGVGVWRLVKKRSEERSGVAIVPTTEGGFVTYSGGF